MTSRFENKLLINRRQLAQLQESISEFMVADQHGESYKVTSLYFDSENDLTYWQKKNGDFERYKYRIRYYDDQIETAFCEVKQRKGDHCAKYRDPITSKNWLSLVGRDGNDWFTLEEDSPFAYHFYHHHLVPKLWVRFDRCAYVDEYEQAFRLTIDRSLESHLYHFDSKKLGSERPHESQFGIPIETYDQSEFTLIEVKHGGHTPTWWSYLQRQWSDNFISFSKYCEGRELFFA